MATGAYGFESTTAQFTSHRRDGRHYGDSGSPDEHSVEAQFDNVVAVVESIDNPVHVLSRSGGTNFGLGAAPQISNRRSLILYDPYIPSDENGDGDEFEETIAEMMALVDEGKDKQALTLFCNDFGQFSRMNSMRFARNRYGTGM